MKLIGSLSSPFARKVRVALAEKRVDYEFVIDPPSDPATRVPEFNPLGKIPVLVIDDGSTIFDSPVIVEYLDSISPVGRLIPEPIRQRIQVRRWEAVAETYTLADIALGCALGFLDFRFKDIDWRSKYANLRQHADKVYKLPPFEATVPQG
jgi:glutathione S-transferase